MICRNIIDHAGINTEQKDTFYHRLSTAFHTTCFPHMQHQELQHWPKGDALCMQINRHDKHEKLCVPLTAKIATFGSDETDSLSWNTARATTYGSHVLSRMHNVFLIGKENTGVTVAYSVSPRHANISRGWHHTLFRNLNLNLNKFVDFKLKSTKLLSLILDVVTAIVLKEEEINIEVKTTPPHHANSHAICQKARVTPLPCVLPHMWELHLQVEEKLMHYCRIMPHQGLVGG